MEPTAMETIMDGMTDVVTALTGVVTSLTATIVAEPLLLIPVLTGFVGGGIMLFKALRR